MSAANLGAALRAADPALANRLAAFARRGGASTGQHAPDARPWRDRRDRGQAQSRHAPPRRPPAETIAQAALAPLGRLVILTRTDLPSSFLVAAARPGDHSGLVCAYLASDLYNHFGWWFEPDGGGAVDIAQFGMRLDVFPREGAWTFRAARAAPSPRKWSDLDVGSSVLHIRFKGEIEAALKGEPPRGDEP